MLHPDYQYDATHYDRISSNGQSSVVAGLLITAVTKVLAVDQHVQAKMSGDGDRVVLGDVIDEDDPAHKRVRDVVVSTLQGLGRVVRRHDHDDTGLLGLGRSLGCVTGRVDRK